MRRNPVYVNAKWAEGTPKNHERRDVPMPRMVTDAPKPICEQREHEERVFRDVRGSPIRKQSLARETGWRTHTPTRLGWKRDDWPMPHDLRHTAAPLAVHAGANVKAPQRMPGHKNASMTLDVYADPFDSDLMDMARPLDAAVQVETGVEECGQNVGKNRAREAPCHNTKSAPSGSSQALCELSAMPDGAELCDGYAARSRRCLMALTPMSVPTRMPSALRVVTIAST